MRPTIFAAALAVLALGACQPAQGEAAATVQPANPSDPTLATYSDPAVGIAFDHAADRQVRACEVFEGEQPRPCVELVELIEGETVPLLRLLVVDGDLETVAREEAGFEPDAQGRWMTTYGRFEPVAVERFRSGDYQGMKAVVTCGIEGENGFHAAGGECLWAVIGDGGRAVVATTDGLYGLDDATQATLNSVRLLPAG